MEDLRPGTLTRQASYQQFIEFRWFQSVTDLGRHGPRPRALYRQKSAPK